MNQSGYTDVITRFNYFLIPYVLILCLVLISSCSDTNHIINPSVSSKIPNGSQKIILVSGLTVDSLYRSIYTTLAAEGFGIIHSSNRMHTISTRKADLPFVSLEVNAATFVDSTGSRAMLTGYYPVGCNFNIAF